MPRTLYAVSSGSYSDYDVLAVFEQQEDAETAVAAGYGEDVTEIEYWPAGTGPKKVDVWIAVGYVNDAPEISPEIRTWPVVEWGAPVRRPILTETPQWNGVIQVHVKAGDREGALKACSDRITQRRAERLEPSAGDPEVDGQPSE